MTKYYEYGIDLGTTNSCISKYNENSVRVYKNSDKMSVTPSVVYISPRRDFVGKEALSKMFRDPMNAASAFKRSMGTDAMFDFEKANIRKTPIELSAMILKSLANDVYRMEQIPVENVIITVPAAFGTLQCDATYRAGIEAGFKNVLLLQEPIAAAVAYGLKENSRNQYWLVYDFGGGTFDVAVVSTFDDRLTILNHEGDNHLGGKDIDEIFLRTFIHKEFVTKEDFVDLEDKEVRVRLLSVAEETKEHLSTLDEVRLIVDGDEIFGDSDLSIDVIVSRSEFEKEIDVIIEKTLELTEKAIKDSGVPREKFTKIALVGGTTYIPAVRNALKDRFGIPLDYSLDPMTVVSEGASIFGATKKVENDQYELSSDIETDEVNMQLEYDALTPEPITNIIGKVHGLNEVGEVEFKIDEISGFSTSGWKRLEPGNIIDVDIQLQPNKLNNFNIVFRTNKGVLIVPKDNSIRIRHQKDALLTSAPPIPMSFCVEIDTEGNGELIPLIKKGVSLPAKSAKTFKAAKTISSDSEDFIAIKVWEGEQFKYPSMNNWVGILKIEGSQINKTIMAGQEIDVTIRIDESRRVFVSAAIPDLGIFLQKDQIYETIDLDYKSKFNEIYLEIETIIEEIGDWDSDTKEDEISELIIELDEIKENFDMYSYSEYEDSDRALKLMHEFNGLKRKYLSIREHVKHESESKDRIEDIEKISNVIKDYGSTEEKQIFSQLHNAYNNSHDKNDEKQVELYYSKMSDLRYSVLWGNFGFIYYMYRNLLDEKPNFTDRSKALLLMKEADDAITNESASDLRDALFGLYELLHVDSKHIINEKDLPSGLRL
jgi:molecular chaperone DnaK